MLTAAGSVLVEHAERVLAELLAAEAALADLAAVRTGRLRFASFATAGATIVPRAVDAFRAQHPDVDVRVEQAASGEAVARLRQGNLDLALVVDQDPVPGVEIVPLFEDPFRVALHRSHPLALAPGELQLTELADERWIDVPRQIEGGQVLAAAGARTGLHFRVVYESDDYTAIHELVGAGLGVALLPDLALFPDNDAVVLRPLAAPAPFRRIQAVVRPAPAALRRPPRRCCRSCGARHRAAGPCGIRSGPASRRGGRSG